MITVSVFLNIVNMKHYFCLYSKIYDIGEKLFPLYLVECLRVIYFMDELKQYHAVLS